MVDCPYTGAVCDLRQNSDIIAVACLEGGSEPANTTLTAPGTLSEGYRLRLAGGFDRCQGDLEVFIPFLQDWALAVSKEFGMDEAAVTCSELGCGMSFRITTSLRYIRESVDSLCRDDTDMPICCHTYEKLITAPTLHLLAFLDS